MSVGGGCGRVRRSRARQQRAAGRAASSEVEKCERPGDRLAKERAALAAVEDVLAWMKRAADCFGGVLAGAEQVATLEQAHGVVDCLNRGGKRAYEAEGSERASERKGGGDAGPGEEWTGQDKTRHERTRQDRQRQGGCLGGVQQAAQRSAAAAQAAV